MKIAIIGAGNVGGTLAKKWGAQGHSLFLGVKDPGASEVIALLKEIGIHASAHLPQDAVREAEVVLLATPWSAVSPIASSLGSLLDGKILIDCTNPLKPDLGGLELGFNTSGAEELQKLAPKSFVFKAFNTVGFNIMADPVLEGRKTVMFYCGNSGNDGNQASRRERVRELVEAVGFEAVDTGPISSARLLEPWALLWIQSAYKNGLGRDFGFSIVRRSK